MSIHSPCRLPLLGSGSLHSSFYTLFKPGQYIAGIGEIQGPSHLDVALIEIW